MTGKGILGNRWRSDGPENCNLAPVLRQFVGDTHRYRPQLHKQKWMFMEQGPGIRLLGRPSVLLETDIAFICFGRVRGGCRGTEVIQQAKRVLVIAV